MRHASSPISPFPIPTHRVVIWQWLWFTKRRDIEILGEFRKLPMGETEFEGTQDGHERYQVMKHDTGRTDWPYPISPRMVAVRLERKKSWWQRIKDWIVLGGYG